MNGKSVQLNIRVPDARARDKLRRLIKYQAAKNDETMYAYLLKIIVKGGKSDENRRAD